MRLIDADRLKKVFSRNVAGGNAYFDLIDNAPTVEAIPKERIEQMIAEIQDVYIGYRHGYEVMNDVMLIIHKYTKEQTDERI